MLQRVMLLTLLFLSTPLLAQSEVEILFDKANQAMEAEDYQEALEGYRKVLAIERTTGALWNAGMAAFLLGLPEEAKGYWKDLKKADPEDFGVRAKLVQVYQMLGDTTGRDAERVALISKWKQAPKSSELGQKTEFCRDQFLAGGHRVFVMEQYAFEDPRAVLYVFVSPDNPAQKGKWLSLGSYKATNDYMREVGELGPNERAFHLDGYDNQNQHWTYDFYKGEPSYEDVKEKVTAILEGRVQPISSTTKTP